jgi:hypothetical protein
MVTLTLRLKGICAVTSGAGSHPHPVEGRWSLGASFTTDFGLTTVTTVHVREREDSASPITSLVSTPRSQKSNGRMNLCIVHKRIKSPKECTAQTGRRMESARPQSHSGQPLACVDQRPTQFRSSGGPKFWTVRSTNGPITLNSERMPLGSCNCVASSIARTAKTRSPTLGVYWHLICRGR